ncbi:putative glycosyltransferase EpsF [Clostridia bacterium]|nr:putative glycosyltransferase EpsF [Clostridia bacterium]
MIMNLYRTIERSAVQFDFMVYKPEKGIYEDEVKTLGGRVYHTPPFELRTLAAYIRSLDTFFREHTEYRIVHNHMGSNGAFVCRAARKHNIPVVIVHSHSGFAPMIVYEPRILLRKVIMTALSKISNYYCTDRMACSKEAGQAYFGRRSKDIIVLHNALDTNIFRYDPRERERVQNIMGLSGLVIGHVGRFDLNKNHVFLLNVFHAVLRRKPEAVLLLVGEGILSEQIYETARSLGISENVRFLGVREDIQSLMQVMDVFVMPSKIEGLPVACIEAQATGLPCIISSTITAETAVTSLCRFLSLNDTPELWADAAITAASTTIRKDMSAIITAAGYEISQTAAWLRDYYIEKYNGTEQ